MQKNISTSRNFKNMKNNFEQLKGKVAVITGGAGVIGTVISEAVTKAGIKTAILDLNGEAAEKLANRLEKETSTKCIGLKSDVLDKEQLIINKKEINKKLGTIDFLINGAGGNSPKATTKIEQMETAEQTEGSFYELDLAGFDMVFNLNFKGTLLPTMVFTTDMLKKEKGAIVNISSMTAFKPLTKVPAYSAAKAAVNSITEWLAVHLAKTGIRVNAIAPGFFLTEQNRFLLTKADGSLTDRGKKIIAQTPTEKFGEVEELGGAVLFLLSDMAKFMTGIVVPIDGGYNAFGGV